MPAHSRLSRLALVLALFVLPTLTTAQTPNTPTAASTKDSVLFDFESGNFDGWTLTGDCWDKAPATPKTFTDKQGNSAVSGIVGNGYLTTLYKNAATTGKAVSKDFPIDKPFLTFKIGGGRHPKEACLNLLVDGKIVRTETGTDSATLVPASWDVYAFMGKTAHLEIVDATPSQQRGYIMVDDVRLSDKPTKRYMWPPRDFGIKAQYIPECRFFRSQHEVVFGRQIEVGLSPQQFDLAINEVYKRMLKPDLDHVAGRSVHELAMMIQSRTEQVIKRLGIEDRPSLMKKWLLAEAVCARVATHVTYDATLVDAPAEVKIRRANPAVVLQQSPASAVCSGQSSLTTALATELGIKSTHLGGEVISYGEKPKGHNNHGWIHFDFGDGIESVADTSQDAMSLEDMRRINGKMNRDYILPRTPIEFELFLAKHYAYGVANKIDESRGWEYNVKETTPYYALTNMACGKWLDADTAYLKDVWKQYREAEYKKIKILNSIPSITECMD